jgi:hypothetical protein
MSEQGVENGSAAEAPKLKMMMRAQNWSVKARVNRSGREDGEVIILTGHVFAPTIDPNTPLSKARAEVKLKAAQDRMAVKIGKDETFISVPLEDFAMERISAKIKELSGSFGLELGIEFEAGETTDRQQIEYAEFTFSSRKPAAQPQQRPAAAAPAKAPAQAAAPAAR